MRVEKNLKKKEVRDAVNKLKNKKPRQQKEEEKEDED